MANEQTNTPSAPASRRPSFLQRLSTTLRQDDSTGKEPGSLPSQTRTQRIMALFKHVHHNDALTPDENNRRQSLPETARPSEFTNTSDSPPPYSTISGSYPAARNTHISFSNPRLLFPELSAYSLPLHRSFGNPTLAISQASMRVEADSEQGTDEASTRAPYPRPRCVPSDYDAYSENGLYTPSELSLDGLSPTPSSSPTRNHLSPPITLPLSHPHLDFDSPRHPPQPSRDSDEDFTEDMRRNGARNFLRARLDSDLALALHLQEQETYDFPTPPTPTAHQCLPPSPESPGINNDDDQTPLSLPVPVPDTAIPTTHPFGLARTCILCHASLSVFSFPTHLPTTSCMHDGSVCSDCLKKECLVKVETLGWRNVACPQCGKVMGKDDVVRAMLM